MLQGHFFTVLGRLDAMHTKKLEIDASPRSLLLNVNAYVAPAFRKSGRAKLDSKESQESW